MRDVELGEAAPAGISAPETANVGGLSPDQAFTTGSTSAAQVDVVGLTRRHDHEQPRGPDNEHSSTSGTADRFDIISHCATRCSEEGYSNFAFLLWGSADSERGETWAVDVPLTDLGAEDMAMKQLAKKYREARGLLGSVFYLRVGARMKPVKFRLVYRNNKKFRAHITGPLSTEVQQAGIRERLAEITTEFEQRNEEEEFEHSGQDDGGTLCCEVHTHEDSHGSWCYVGRFLTERNLLTDRLQWWETIDLISLFFRDPAALRGQKVLVGPSDDPSFLTGRELEYNESLVYTYLQFYDPERGDDRENSRLLSQSLRYVELTGLFVTDAWHIGRCVSAFVGLAVVLVLASKVLLETWEAAFSAGSFFLAIPMLVLAVTSYLK